jgi:hypothetical protein
MEIEKKIWLPPNQDEMNDQGFRKGLENLVQRHRVGTVIVMYVNFADPQKGKVMVIGQPSAAWLNASWQRLRLFISDLITTGKVK